jgi:hypothetical protein
MRFGDDVKANALMESYQANAISEDTSLLYKAPCELSSFVLTDIPNSRWKSKVAGIRLIFEAPSQDEFTYIGRLVGSNEFLYWHLTAIPMPAMVNFNGGEGTLHKEFDQDGRMAYVGSWWESWTVGAHTSRFSGLWIIRMGG